MYCIERGSFELVVDAIIYIYEYINYREKIDRFICIRE